MSHQIKMMGPFEAVRTCLKKYFTFSGRAQRSEYWWFYLATILISLSIESLISLFPPNLYVAAVNFALAVDVFFLIPIVSASWRRMHDIDKSGWFSLIPLIGLAMVSVVSFFGAPEFFVWVFLALAVILGIYLLSLLTTRSDPGANRFGPPPGQLAAEDVKSVFE